MVNKAQREFDSEADDLPNTATCFDALQVLQQSIKPLGAYRKHNNIINYFTTSDKDDEKIIYKNIILRSPIHPRFLVSALHHDNLASTNGKINSFNIF